VDCVVDIDAIWNTFCATLPVDLQSEARILARGIGLVPLPAVPWSGVFKHEGTLAAPALLATAMPRATREMVAKATTAHMLAVIDAFAVDRMLDRQAAASPQMLRLLQHVRAERDRAMRELTGGRKSPYLDTEYEAVCAINTERLLLQHGVPLSFSDYSRLSLAKLAVAFPAPLALAKAAGLENRRQRAVHRILRAIGLGLQLHDDVVDWEEDWSNGGAWAVSLAGGLGVRMSANRRRKPDIQLARHQVHQSGVLAAMMELARWRYREAWRLAAWLGARSVSEWARRQEATLTDLAERESNAAGYAVRAHQLSGWALEVLG
jgi:geranylgeranyl pyrophosphate synthase